MNGKECLLAFADLGGSYIIAANDTETLRRSFLQQKKRRTQMIGAVCGCIVVVLAVAFFGSGRWFRRTPSVLPAVPETTDRSETEPSSSDAPSTVPDTAPSAAPEPPTQSPEPYSVIFPDADETTKAPEEAAFYCLSTYSIVGSRFSAYLPGKVVEAEMVGDRLESAVATTRYVYYDGTTVEDETLRCEIFALTGVDPETAVCVRFIDKGKNLTTDHYYLLYDPGAGMTAKEADLSAIEAYLIPRIEANDEE